MLVTAVVVCSAGRPWAVVSTPGPGRIDGQRGPHGFVRTALLLSSAVRQQRLGVRGADDNSLLTIYRRGFDLVGRFLMIIPAMALAGALGEEDRAPSSSGSFPVTGAAVRDLVVAVIGIVGG